MKSKKKTTYKIYTLECISINRRATPIFFFVRCVRVSLGVQKKVVGSFRSHFNSNMYQIIIIIIFILQFTYECIFGSGRRKPILSAALILWSNHQFTAEMTHAREPGTRATTLRSIGICVTFCGVRIPFIYMCTILQYGHHYVHKHHISDFAIPSGICMRLSVVWDISILFQLDGDWHLCRKKKYERMTHTQNTYGKNIFIIQTPGTCEYSAYSLMYIHIHFCLYFFRHCLLWSYLKSFLTIFVSLCARQNNNGKEWTHLQW